MCSMIQVQVQHPSVLQSATPVLLSTTKCFSSTTLYSKVLLRIRVSESKFPTPSFRIRVSESVGLVSESEFPNLSFRIRRSSVRI